MTSESAGDGTSTRDAKVPAASNQRPPATARTLPMVATERGRTSRLTRSPKRKTSAAAAEAAVPVAVPRVVFEMVLPRTSL